MTNKEQLSNIVISASFRVSMIRESLGKIILLAHLNLQVSLRDYLMGRHSASIRRLSSTLFKNLLF